MKKTLIALAALASIGSAFAQTAPTITPYARIDLGVGQTTVDGLTSGGLTAVNSGYNTSNFGLKGESEIGGGSKIFGKVEAGFHPASAKGFALDSWGRTGIIGVSGSFGAVQLGMDWSPYDNAFNEAMDYNHFSAIAWAWNGGGVHADSGNDPTGYNGGGVGHVQYTTPTMGGFNASLMYAPSKDTTTGNDTSYTAAGVNYNAGPLALTAAYEHVATAVNSATGAIVNCGCAAAVTNNVATAGDGKYTNAMVLTGAYNLGVATVYAAFESAKADGVLGGGNGSATDTGSSIGVKVPVGALELSAGYATETTSGDISNKRTAYAIQGLYALNKTAKAYIGYVKGTDNTTNAAAQGNEPANPTGADINTTKWVAGLTFSF